MGLWRVGHKQVNAKSQPLSRRRRRQRITTTSSTHNNNNNDAVDNTRSIIERRTNYFENVCLKLAAATYNGRIKNKTWVI